MASADTTLIGSRPALATTYEGDDPALLERIVPLIDAIEITPDAIARSDGRGASLRLEVLEEYVSAAPDVSFIAHGVGLSIGSFDHWNDEYLRLLDDLFTQVELDWHSEHLACTMVGGENLGTMLALPRTEEVLDLVCERVQSIQQRYGVPFLLEHVIHLLPDGPAQFTPAGFLNAITSRTGCGLILDVYNLECDNNPTSPFIEKLSRDFLRFLKSDPDPLIRSVSQFEWAFIETRAGSTKSFEVLWDRHPDHIILALDAGSELPAEDGEYYYRMRIGRGIPSLVSCTREPFDQED